MAAAEFNYYPKNFIAKSYILEFILKSIGTGFEKEEVVYNFNQIIKKLISNTNSDLGERVKIRVKHFPT